MEITFTVYGDDFFPTEESDREFEKWFYNYDFGRWAARNFYCGRATLAMLRGGSPDNVPGITGIVAQAARAILQPMKDE